MKQDQTLFYFLGCMICIIALLISCQEAPGTGDGGGGLTVPDDTAAPVFTPQAGVYSGPQTVNLSSATADASIRYTTDGTTPSENSGTLYSAPFSVVTDTTVKALAYKTGYNASAVVTAPYTILYPEIQVWADTGSGFAEYQNGESVDFGYADYLGSAPHRWEKEVTFRIVCPSGNADLSLTGSPDPVEIIQPESYFSFSSAQPAAAIPSGQQEEFVVYFYASSSSYDVGQQRADISIANDDEDENPFMLEIECYASS